MPTELHQPLMMPNDSWKKLLSRMMAINAIAVSETGTLPVWDIDETGMDHYWEAYVSFNGAEIIITVPVG